MILAPEDEVVSEWNFKKQVVDVLTNLEMSREECTSYLSDAYAIRNHVVGQMACVEEFKKYLDSSTMIGSFFNEFSVDKPDEFDIQLKLKIPGGVQVARRRHSFGGINLLMKTPSSCGSYGETPFSCGRKICCLKLREWVREIVDVVFQEDDLWLYMKSERVYRVSCAKNVRGSSAAHTLYAVDDDSGRRLAFDLLPCFELERNVWPGDRERPAAAALHSWLAVPVPKKGISTFVLHAPTLENELLRVKRPPEPLPLNIMQCMRLMKEMRDLNRMPCLTNDVIKSAFLWEAERQQNNEGFWNQPPGNLIIHMTDRLLSGFRKRRVASYWAQKVNLLNNLQWMDVGFYRRKLEMLSDRLHGWRNGDTAFTVIAEIFGF